MKHKALWAAGLVALLLLLRSKKSPAAAADSTPATSSGFAPIGLATLYFDPGQTYDVNANVNSPTFGNQLN